MVAAIQAASACSSAASSRVTHAGGTAPDRDRGPPWDQRGRRYRLHRGGHDGRIRAVVPGELDRGRAGEIRREPAEDADVGAAEAVDGLIRIPDRGQPGAVAGDHAEQVVLHRVDVLVFVHADLRPAGAQPGRDGRIVVEQGRGHLHQAVEVHQVAGRQLAAQGQLGRPGPRQPGDQLASVPLGAGQFGRDLRAVTVSSATLNPRAKPGRVVVLAQDPQAQAVERGHRGLAARPRTVRPAGLVPPGPPAG